MQIACKRFSCQKAVEVCYWSCKFRRNCKDWQMALAGEPGLVAIQSRLETAAAKTGRAFDPQTLASPVRNKQRSSHPLTKHAGNTDQPATVTMPIPAPLSGKPHAPVDAVAAHPLASLSRSVSSRLKKTVKVKKVSMSQSDESRAQDKAAKAKPVARPKPATNGPVYLLLQKNGRYKELREQDLVTQAPLLLKDKSLRLVKGQLLVPTISFTTNED
jgi:hypothetical protein